MGFEAGLTLLVLLAVLGLLAFSAVAADIVLAAALVVLLLGGVLDASQALVGFSNPGVITVAALYVVAAGLKETGAVQWLVRYLLGSPRSERRALARLTLPTAAFSALLNNTAVVAMFIPAIVDWARRLGLAPSRLLIPLSYAAILGGTCTLIGTSTNLIVDGLLQQQAGVQLGLFEVAWVGLPLVLLGTACIVLLAPLLLPARGGVEQTLEEVRQYSVEVQVDPGGPLVGRSIAEAGLRALQFGYLAEIERAGELLTVVEPGRTLHAGDYLYFVGAPECAAELRRIQGLSPARGHVDKLSVKNSQRCLVEVVLGPDFPFLDQTIRQSRFRTRFNAVVLSVSRAGEQSRGKLGDITFRAGDTLLLEASRDFADQYRFRRDFLLVSPLNDSTPPDFSRAPVALGLLALLVGLSATGLLSILEASLVVAGLMIATRCISATRARRSFDLPVLLVIACSFALGEALAVTGLAQGAVDGLLGLGLASPWLALALLYVATVLLTEVLTNNAAAVLMFPVAMAFGEQLGVSFLPFVLGVMFAASASFITPLGYQTNLMVMGPGRYRYGDFARLGLPLSLVVGVVAVVLIPLVWAF